MNDRHRFHRLVMKDLAVATQWYEEISPRVASRFRQAVEQAFERIEEFPSMYAKDEDGFHYCRVKRFPFLIQYSTDKKIPIILGVYHSSTNSETWRQRES